MSIMFNEICINEEMLPICIYIFLKEKTKTGHIRIINLFPSGFDINQEHQKY